MNATRLDAEAAVAAADRIRATVPPAASVSDAVAEIIAAVRDGGDAAVLSLEARFGGDAGAPLRVPGAELAAALAALDPDVRAGLEVAVANVGAVARAGVDSEAIVQLLQGHRVTLREVPVARAAVYAPGGRNPYPSSVVMGAITARAAGVGEIVLAAPAHPVILAAAALCEVDAVFRMGGAQAIAALAYGTESVPRVDVVVGPGSLYVQEAKRQVAGRVGIDGFAGPSDLTVIASGAGVAGGRIRALAADLAAQAEHGEGSLTVGVSDDPALLDALGAEHAVLVADMDAALAFAEALAPEHLQLAGAAAEALAPRVTRAGCLFVGAASGTAFGDYVAGSNHVLPTEGAARFASGLSARHFRRRMAEVRIDAAAAAALARAGEPVARAEGFPAHAASLAMRLNQGP